MTPAPKREENHHQDISKLMSLCEISKSLCSCLELKEIYPRILSVLAQQTSMKRGGVILLNSEANDWEMGCSHGISSEEMKRKKEYFGSGVISRIVEKGQMAIVVGAGDTFWIYDKTKSTPRREGHLFLCSPVKTQGAIAAVLGVDRLFDDATSLTEDLNFLGEVCSVLGEAMAMRKAIAAENRLLLEENWSFRKELETLGRSVPKTRKRISLTEILEERISRMISEMKVDPRSNGCLYDEVLNVVEKTLLKSSLDKTRHVQLKTARFLGINRNTLRRKIKELGITAAEK